MIFIYFKGFLECFQRLLSAFYTGLKGAQFSAASAKTDLSS